MKDGSHAWGCWRSQEGTIGSWFAGSRATSGELHTWPLYPPSCFTLTAGTASAEPGYSPLSVSPPSLELLEPGTIGERDSGKERQVLLQCGGCGRDEKTRPFSHQCPRTLLTPAMWLLPQQPILRRRANVLQFKLTITLSIWSSYQSLQLEGSISQDCPLSVSPPFIAPAPPAHILCHR